jgi:hypothetical protein
LPPIKAAEEVKKVNKQVLFEPALDIPDFSRSQPTLGPFPITNHGTPSIKGGLTSANRYRSSTLNRPQTAVSDYRAGRTKIRKQSIVGTDAFTIWNPSQQISGNGRQSILDSKINLRKSKLIDI